MAMTTEVSGTIRLADESINLTEFVTTIEKLAYATAGNFVQRRRTLTASGDHNILDLTAGGGLEFTTVNFLWLKFDREVGLDINDADHSLSEGNIENFKQGVFLGNIDKVEVRTLAGAATTMDYIAGGT